MSKIKYPSGEAIKKLSEELNLGDISCQDWEYTSADESRIEELIEYYCENNLNDVEKFTLMIVIISSCDDAIGSDSLEEEMWIKVKGILIEEKDIHLNTIEYWASLEQDIEDSFNISILMREILNDIMNFKIQVGCPQNNLEGGYSKDTKISDVIQDIFPLITENLLIIWKGEYIPLNYKYDVSGIIEDVLLMLKEIRRKPLKGEFKFNERYYFECKWSEGKIIIDSIWNNKLDEGKIIMELCEFTYEWKKLLEVLINSLEQCGYNLDTLEDMEKLYDEYKYIDKYGLLYEE